MSMFFCLSLLITLVVQNEPEIVRLEGPRKPVVTIRKINKDYELSIEMTPVGCFDPKFNDRINLKKAEFYSKVALFRSLTDSKQGFIEFVALPDATVKTKNNRLIYTVRAPFQSIRISTSGVRDLQTKPGVNPKQTVRLDKELSVARLLSVKNDYVETLSFVSEILESMFPTINTKEEDFFIMVSDCEESIDDTLTSLRHEINMDLLLLNHEKEELYSELKREKEWLFNRLSGTVDRFNAKNEKVQK